MHSTCRFDTTGGIPRPRAFQKAITRREAFDKYVARFPTDKSGHEIMPWCVGSAVLCRGQPGIIEKFASGVLSTREDYAGSVGGCSIRFEVDGEKMVMDYTSLGRGKGGARLQRPPPSLRTTKRSTCGHLLSKEVKDRVRDTYHAECLPSPHQGDERVKRLSRHVVKKAQAIIIMSDLQSLYKTHLQRFPQDAGRVSFAMFKRLRPWYAIKGMRQTCLCKWCENFLCYQDALRLAAGYLEPLLPAYEHGDGEESDEEGANRVTVGQGEAAERPLAKLVRICQMRSKQEIVQEFLCGGSVPNASKACVMGECPHCGFSQLWSKGLRKDIVGAEGNVKSGVDKAWLTKIKWERIKSGNKTLATDPLQSQPTMTSNEILRQRCEGTIIDLLDEFELRVMPKYPFHRQTLINQKKADSDREANMPPGVLDADSDYSENGPIANAREIQSEYWTLKTYTLFISIWSYLSSSAWKDREGLLHVGQRVTVEPNELAHDAYGTSLEVLEGSFYAEVLVSSDTVGEHVVYTVIDRNNERHEVPRFR